MLRYVDSIVIVCVLICTGCVSQEGKRLSASKSSVDPEMLAEDTIKPLGGLDDASTHETSAASIQKVSRVEPRSPDSASSPNVVVRAKWDVGDSMDVRSGDAIESQLEDAVESERLGSVSANPRGTLAAYFAGLPESEGATDPQDLDESSGLTLVVPLEKDAASMIRGSDLQGIGEEVEPGMSSSVEGLQVNLPTVMAMVDSQHPAVGIAQWRVQQAYAQLTSARSLWLPSIRGAVSLHRHDGNYQASNGAIVDVNRSSLQYGLGAGATGAGTTAALPGVVAQFHFADAIFQPSIAQSRAHAHGHAARAVMNRQMLDAALAYLELLAAHQDMEIIRSSQEQIEQLAELTKSFADAGEGLRADADRLQTEWLMIQSRRVAAGERIAVAESRLSHSVSENRQTRWIPMDITVVPWEMVGDQADSGELVATGLRVRPELRESQSLVAAACDAYEREKYAPFVPSVLLGFSTGGFGGGLGGRIDDVEGRYDFDAMVGWEIRNLGFGERAARREASARIQQAKFEKLRVLDQVANEIREGAAQVKTRRQQIDLTAQAIEVADSSVRRNLDRIREGAGLPIEALQAVQAKELASQAYLQSVTRYNEAQLRLQFAIGWPETPSESIAISID